MSDCMIVDQSSPLCGWRGEYFPSVTAQGGTGVIVIASSQGGAKTTASVDDTKRPTLAELIKSQESLHKDNVGPKAHIRAELLKPKALDTAAIVRHLGMSLLPECVRCQSWGRKKGNF